MRRSHEVVLIDGCTAAHVAAVGELLHEFDAAGPTFAVGSSGVESALCAAWRQDGTCPGYATFAPVADRGPILVVCGSCSPVTARQIAAAAAAGFAELSFDGTAEASERTVAGLVTDAAAALAAGRSVVLHSAGATAGARGCGAASTGRTLGTVARRVLEGGRVGRVVVAGGDTSSEIARVLGIRSVEMVGELTRGSPLCRAAAPSSPAEGLEFTFKGGQIGPADFFSRVQRGTPTEQTQ